MINPRNMTDEQKERVALNHNRILDSKKKDLAKAKVVGFWLENELASNKSNVNYLTKEIDRLENADPVEEYISNTLLGGF